MKRTDSLATAWIASVWRRVAESEAAYFIRLLLIARSGDPDATFPATLAWLDRAWRAQQRRERVDSLQDRPINHSESA